MYTWYFPKVSPADLPGRRHDWKNCILWIGNPALDFPKILEISMSSDNQKYISSVPPGKSVLSGNRSSIAYYSDQSSGEYHGVKVTTRRGSSQDPVMWEQLTEEARIALQTTEFDEAWVPMKDGNFTANLKEAWPF